MKKSYIYVAAILILLVMSEFIFNKNSSELILKVNDTLYYGTDETGPMGDSECVEGEIISTVDEGEVPTENGCSNFGCVGNAYTYDTGDGFIMVFMDDEKWHCFYSERE